MNAERKVALTCGLVALAAIACVGLCGLGAALMTAGTAVGIGRAMEIVMPAGPVDLTPPDWSPEGFVPFEGSFDARVSGFAEALAEEIVQSSDVVAQALRLAGSSPEVRQALGSPLEVGALLGEAHLTESMLAGEASLTLELKGSLATGTLEIAGHRGPRGLRIRPATDEPTFRIPGTGLTLPLYWSLRAGDWVFDKLVVTLPSGEEIVLAGTR